MVDSTNYVIACSLSGILKKKLNAQNQRAKSRTSGVDYCPGLTIVPEGNAILT